MSVHMRNYAIAGLLAVVLLAVGGIALTGGTAVADGGSLRAMDVGTKPNAPEAGWNQDNKGNWCYWGDSDGDNTPDAWLVSQWLVTEEAPSNDSSTFPAGEHRYWLDKDGVMAKSRIINPSKDADKEGNSYLAYATDDGFVATETKPIQVSDYDWVLPKDSSGQLLAGGQKTANPTKTQKSNGITKLIYMADANGKLVVNGNVNVANGKASRIFKSKNFNSKKEVRYYCIDTSAKCAIVTKAPVKVANYGWVYPYYSDGHLMIGKVSVKPSSKQRVGTKVYLAKKKGYPGKLETGNVKANGKTTQILKTSAYDTAKGKAVTRYYYINSNTHCATVTNKPVRVSNFGWVYPYYKGGYLVTGRTAIGDKVYLARANGKLETGNKQGFFRSKNYNAKKQSLLYYINPKTHAITWGKPVQVSKSFGYVYAPSKAGNLLTGLKKVDSKHIILAEKNGRVYNKRGWLVTGTYTGPLNRYWMEPTTKNKKVIGARLGYFKVKGTLYQGLSQGYVLRNKWKKLNGTYYWANNDGKIRRDNVVMRMISRAQGYSSPSRYLLMVDIDNPRMIVFEGHAGNWRVKYLWQCCTGHPSTPTITGTFSLGAKGYSFGEEHGYSCYYYSQISGGYLFHSQLYHAYTRSILDPQIGVRCSHGCVRLYIDNALWLQRHVPSGTTVACIR